MSKVDDMTDEEVERTALQLHQAAAVHLCEHGHPDHAQEPGGPCILDAVNRRLQLELYGHMPVMDEE